MATNESLQSAVEAASVSLTKDNFMRSLIRDLSETLEEVVGLKEAAGFVSVVGQKMGAAINADYKAALGIPERSKEQVADVLVDLKRRIDGDFYVIEEDEEKIVLGNRRCPFGDKVLGRPSMCMMTSNVFGSITAQNLGYSKVELKDTIAQGKAECRVVVYLKQSAESEAARGREYYKGLNE